jgi:hypothetical protein
MKRQNRIVLSIIGGPNMERKDSIMETERNNNAPYYDSNKKGDQA